jgi:hypothetical protein
LIHRIGLPRSQRAQALLAFLFYVVLANIAFFPFVWGDKSMMSSARDAASILAGGAYPEELYATPSKVLDAGAPAWVTEPEFKIMHDQITREHVLPLWNPYEAFGDPLAATMQAQPFYPPAWLMIAHPSPHVYTMFILVRLLFAAIFAYLFLRLFVGFSGAVVGGLCCMFMGYFLIYYDMPEVSVEVTISMLFFAIEWHLRRRTWYSALLLAASTWLVIVGGMPESSVLVMGLGILYALLRIAMLGERRLGASWHIALAMALGGTCAAFFVLPSIEFIRVSTNVHELRYTLVPTGLGHDPFEPQNVATYIVPLMFGPPWNSIMANFAGYSGIRGFFGVLPLFFASVATIDALSAWRRWSARPRDAIVVFFALTVVVLIAKRFGAPAVNWIGALPLLDAVIFPKYEEVLTGFSIAMLAGIGFDCAFAPGRRRYVVAAAAGVTFVVVVPIMLWTLTVLGRINTWAIYYWAGNATLLALLIVIFGIAFVLERPNPRLRALKTAALALLCLEATCNYLVPMFYIIAREPNVARNPYAGAPYVRFLQDRTKGGERIFGVRNTLYPNWAGAFGLFDVRGLDALFYKRYFPFQSAFFPRSTDFPDEFVDRFTGATGLAPSSLLQQRFLALSSVGYVVTPDVLLDPKTLVGMLFFQNAGKIAPEHAPQFVPGMYDIAGDRRLGFLEHPIFDRLPLRVRVPKDNDELRFAIGFNRKTYEFPICGEGVRYRLEVRDGKNTRSLFEEYIDPKHVVSQRRWLDRTVSLKAYAGRVVDLLFSTSPGPRNDTCMAWSLWGNLRFAGAQEPRSIPFQMVYNREVRIYRFHDPLSRASVYYSAQLAPTDAAALTALADPKIDVHRTAIVEASQQPALSQAAQLSTGQPIPADAADITSYRSQEVSIRAVARRPGILVLNDTDFPGWNAYLDGKPAATVPANYLFRGVFVPAGTHEVVFRYEPRSWRIGGWISLAGLLCLAGYAALLARPRKPFAEKQRSV